MHCIAVHFPTGISRLVNKFLLHSIAGLLIIWSLRENRVIIYGTGIHRVVGVLTAGRTGKNPRGIAHCGGFVAFLGSFTTAFSFCRAMRSLSFCFAVNGPELSWAIFPAPL